MNPALVPFEGVVGRGLNGGVCPMGVHLPEQGFSAVSDKHRSRTRARDRVRSLRLARMLRVFRAVLLFTRSCVNKALSVLGEQTFAPTRFGCPTSSGSCLRGKMRVKHSFIRCETSTGLSCVNAWDTM